MQKFISIILLVFYTSTQAVGLSFNLHYCGEDITDINILTQQADCCCADYNNESAADCCDDEQVYAKITEEHSAASSISINKWAKTIALTTPHSLALNYLHSSTNKKNSIHNSLISKQSSWLTFNILRL